MNRNRYHRLKGLWLAAVLLLCIISLSTNLSPVWAIDPQDSFTDISTSWARNEINFLADQQIVGGYLDGTFRPQEPITRAEYVDLIVKAFSLPGNGQPVFSDLPADFWALAYITRAHEEGWVIGFPDGTFRPQEPVTRAQALVVLVRMANWTAQPWPYPVPASSWAASYIAAALAHHILLASDPFFQTARAFGDEITSREEAAAFITRTLGQVKRPPSGINVENPDSVDWIAQSFRDRVNQARTDAGLLALNWDPDLANFAASYAEEMGEQGFFSHTSPLSGSFQQRVQKLFALGFVSAGENIGTAERCTPQEVVGILFANFLGSPAHEANILAGNWTLFGCGYWQANGNLIVVLEFGSK